MKSIKTMACAALAATMLMSSCPSAFAENDIQVLLNGTPITFDVPPMIINDRTMVPLRAIFESLGATVDWNGDTRTVTSSLNGTSVNLTVDDYTMYVNGQAVSLDAPACIVDGRTLVPVRAISEAYGANVTWDGNTQTVYITSNGQNYEVSPFQTVKDYIINNGVYSQGLYAALPITISGSYAYLLYDPSNDSILYSFEIPNDNILYRFYIYNNGTDPLVTWTYDTNSDLQLVASFDSSSQKIVMNYNNSSLSSIDVISGAQDTLNALLDTFDVILQSIRSDLDYSDFGLFKISANNIDGTAGNTGQSNVSTPNSDNVFAFSRLKNIIVDNGSLSQGGYAVLRYLPQGDILYYYVPQDDAIKILVSMDDSSTMVTLYNDGTLPTVYNKLYLGNDELDTLGSFNPYFSVINYDYNGLSYSSMGDSIEDIIDLILKMLDLDLQEFTSNLDLSDFGIAYN